MTDDELCRLGVLELARALRHGEVTSLQVTRACLDRIEALNPSLQAFVTITAELALDEAAQADAERAAGRLRGLLHGVPYTLKDVVQTAGIRTTAGSWTLRDWVPDTDATVVTRLRSAGAVLLGKVNTHEFAFGGTTQTVHGSTRNPWNLARIPGGSSGGSGAALAAGLGAFSIGSDTAGSIRLPSAFCGVAGLKPTYGLVSTAGVVAQSYTSDHVGPMARSVGDIAAVMAAIAGPDRADPICLSCPPPEFRASGPATLLGLRIGVPEELMRFAIAPGVAQRFRVAQDVLLGMGAEIRPISIPLLAEATAINAAIVPPETAAQHMAWTAGWLSGLTIRYGDDVAALLETARAVPATATILASRARDSLRAQIDAALGSEVDLLITPTQAIVAPPVGATRVSIGDTQNDLLATLIHFLCPFSLAGVPALALPIGTAEDGLPASIQLVGPRLADPLLLSVGTAFERELASIGEALGPAPR